jgi:DNA-binding transcriptional LysR family regulator
MLSSGQLIYEMPFWWTRRDDMFLNTKLACDNWQQFDEALALVGRTRLVVLTVNQFFTAGKVVAHSDLLTVLPRHFISVTGFAEQLVQHELPFEVPAIHVDALWHQRQDGASAHLWLREKVNALSSKAFPA